MKSPYTGPYKNSSVRGDLLQTIEDCKDIQNLASHVIASMRRVLKTLPPTKTPSKTSTK